MTPEEFLSIWQQSEPKQTPVFYRLYYNEYGEPLFYSMEDLPGNYIEIDQETFNRSPSNIRIVNGEIKILSSSPIYKLVPKNEVWARTKLVPISDDKKGVSCDPRDICVIVSVDQPHQKWSIKRYETD